MFDGNVTVPQWFKRITSLNRAGWAFDKASLAVRSASSFSLISLCFRIQQNVIYFSSGNISCHVWKTLFTRGLRLTPVIQTCYRKKYNFSNEETFTYSTPLLIAFIFAVKCCNQLLAHSSKVTNICRSCVCFNFGSVSVHVTKIGIFLFH